MIIATRTRTYQELYMYYKQENEQLKQELERVKCDLKEAIEVISWYSDHNNYRDHEILGYPTGIVGDDQLGNEFGESKHLTVGGKRARQFLAKLNKEKKDE